MKFFLTQGSVRNLQQQWTQYKAAYESHLPAIPSHPIPMGINSSRWCGCWCAVLHRTWFIPLTHSPRSSPGVHLQVCWNALEQHFLNLHVVNDRRVTIEDWGRGGMIQEQSKANIIGTKVWRRAPKCWWKDKVVKGDAHQAPNQGFCKLEDGTAWLEEASRLHKRVYKQNGNTQISISWAL